MSPEPVSQALSRIHYTLLIIGTEGPEGPHYMVANWGTQASFDPRRFVVAVKKRARTYASIRERRAFTVNLLDASQEDLVKAIMKGHAPAPETKAGVDAPRLPGAFAGFACTLVDALEIGGDHVLVTGDVVDGWCDEAREALTLPELKLSYAG